MPESPQGYAAWVDGVVKAVGKALAPALGFFAGWFAREHKETKEALDEAEKQLENGRKVARRRDDPAERDRVRRLAKAPPKDRG